MVRVKFHSDFFDDKKFYNYINNLYIKNKSGRYKNIQMTLDNNYDYFVIVNYPKHFDFDPKKTIVFQAEPRVNRVRYWGERCPSFVDPNPKDFFFVFSTKKFFNLTFPRCSYFPLEDISRKHKTKCDRLVGVISTKNVLDGQKDRLNFIDQYLDRYDKFDYIVSIQKYYDELKDKYRNIQLVNGTDNCYLPYKYVFQSENCYESNYWTEKIVDPMWCDCLVFYSGCPNISKHIDPRSYIHIDCRDPEKSMYIIKNCIDNHEWEKRLPNILNQKKKFFELINPLNIVQRILNGVYTENGFVNPPREIPKKYYMQFTENTKVAKNYYNVCLPNRNYNERESAKFLNNIKNKKTFNYGITDTYFYKALEKYSVEGYEVLNFGSSTCWYETICLYYGATKIVVAELCDNIKSTHPLIDVVNIKKKEFNQFNKKFHRVVSISTFEHTGLGRYGDEIDPGGDLKSMKFCYNNMVDKGLLFLSVPVGIDHVVWNAHRVYGRYRLPKMFDGFKLIDSFGFSESDFDRTDIHNVYQPIFVLQKV